MHKAKTIFGSSSEKRTFDAITSLLPEGWTLYPNIPFSHIVRAERGELKDGEWDFYLKTSVDFVLTAPTAEPSLALEFDGLGEGFSLGDTYVQARPTDDPYRSLKLNFKLRLCRAVRLPLLVISFEEVRVLRPDDAHILVHSIVGQHIANRVYRDTIRRWDAERRGAGKSPDDILWELAQLRAETQHRYDPFLADLEVGYDRFRELGVSMSLEPLFQPDVLPTLRTNQPFESVGCRFTARGGKLSSPIIQVVWVRNFAGRELAGILDAELPISTGVNPLQVAQNVAWYFGQRRTLESASLGDQKR
jgi:hypothetical protein